MFNFEEDYDYEEVIYTDEEKIQVIDQLRMGLMFSEISLIITKRELKSWFANIQMHKKGEYCPDITGADLVEIARSEGFKII